MRRVPVFVFLLAFVGAFASTQSAPPAASDEVVALTKAQWAAEMKKDVATAMKNVADDYTEFNPDYPTRLDGKQISWKLAEAANGGSDSLVAAEMANEKVQVYGDVAILTYNFIGSTKNKDGKVEATRAKSTRVYVKKNNQWWLVHANFAPAN
jgi:ketosteroid isomerase-like protein